MDEIEDEFGKRIRASYKILDKNPVSARKLEKLAEVLEDRYDIKSSSVKKAIELDIALTIKGTEDTDTNDSTVTVVKIGRKWYPISAYYSNGEYYIAKFLVSSMT